MCRTSALITPKIHDSTPEDMLKYTFFTLDWKKKSNKPLPKSAVRLKNNVWMCDIMRIIDCTAVQEQLMPSKKKRIKKINLPTPV